MSRFLVVDSSVVVKWFPATDEALSAAALELLVQHREQELTLAAPTLLRLEVLNAFWKRRATPNDMASIAETLDAFAIDWHEVTGELATEAGRIAALHDLTVYDAVFVALATQLDADLVTDDSAIIRSAACSIRTLRD